MPNHKPNSRNGYKRNIKKIFELRINLTTKNIFLWLIIGSIIVLMFLREKFGDIPATDKHQDNNWAYNKPQKYVFGG